MTASLITLMVLSVVVYFISKMNWKLGTIVNFLVGLFSMFYVFTLKIGFSETIVLFGQKLYFEWTDVSFYFSMVSLMVIVAIMFFSIRWLETQRYRAAFNMFVLMVTAGSLGVFMAADLITLYIFWEIAVLSSLLVVPMGKEEAKRAAVVYAVMSAVGTYAFLYGAFLIYQRYGTFRISSVVQSMVNDTSTGFKLAVFLLLSLAGIAKSGIFPLHTWIRKTYALSPDAFSSILSGQLSKLGNYIFTLVIAVVPSLKVFSDLIVYSNVPLPNYLLITLGNISIVIGTLMAIKQDDMKMLMAFSSVANGGYILVGLGTMDPLGFEGGMFHIFNHAVASAVIFMAFAAVIYRTKTSKISEMGGLIHKMPITFLAYLFSIISLAGIPPMSGFISKWMIYQALVRKGMFITAFLAFFGSIGSFLYVFRPLAGVFLGQLPKKYREVREAPVVMLVPMALLVLVSFFLGVWPFPVLQTIENIRMDLGVATSFKIVDRENWLIRGFAGSWNTVLVFSLFLTGFVVAYILYSLFPRARKVDLMAPHREEGTPLNVYTGGEFIYSPDLYHYNTNFYAGFERMYRNHPSWEGITSAIGKLFHDIGEWFHRWFFASSASVYTFWVVATLLLIFWVRW
ncbi:proton-conducting transporter membrane subunit [Thermotoga neapolitana]|uniref:NADH dehydrogenase n=1 Tax=Thermotoga neapolitana (strain ATCC 49049 / DSM 4359 / NBRC 107923 / NS-E) TaxID=309803 RepID=B9K9A2_THENN|nr:proton-conducting transporter membrane subunit [Thermotoga neapolitana]ACM23535.1 NADH dehydrogenase [Thermotoga neapolitana DSM 4359]KFZ21164.1 NADH dehydrogenase subunit M [Thermotoga neapolitana LA10]HBF10580.1 oxidoreductase [Thermotoga neapolitana]